jgi:hypothetical protein
LEATKMEAIALLTAPEARELPARKSSGLSVVEVAPGAKARRLFDEARAASFEHLAALASALETVRQLSEDVVAAGDLYAPGVHDLAERLAEETFWRSKSLTALVQRQSGARSVS